MLKKYLKDFSNKYNKDKEQIIESFVEFYGEKYRDRISSRIINLNIICYVPIMFDEKLMPKDLELYLEKIKMIYNYVDDNNILTDNLVIDYNCKKLLKTVKKELPVELLLQSSSMYELNLTVLPIVYNLSHLIHEFNHVIINNELLSEPDLTSNGLEISLKIGNKCLYKDTIFNEVLCERASLDIEEILRNKGINRKRCKSWQENYFIIIERFYQTFKDVYKYSCITGNTNALIKSVGADNYRELVYIVQSLRELEEKEIPLNKDIISLMSMEADEIVDRMIEHYKMEANNQLTGEELDNYINNNGYKKLSLNNYYRLPKLK